MAVIAALTLMPVLLAVGLAVDLGAAQRVKNDLQNAVDSAALAVARSTAAIKDSEIQPTASAYIAASLDAPATITKATLDRDNLVFTLEAKADSPTFFGGLVGKDKLTVHARSVVKGQGHDYEIALVLDTSGSMTTRSNGKTRLQHLKDASKALFDAMMPNETFAQHVKISVVPFASSVNVGPQNVNAAWLDANGLSSIHSENFAGSKRRLDLFDRTKGGMRNVSWGGCVESRPRKVGGATVDYDINDAVPTTSKPDTLFVPWFAPDEPDGDNSGSNKTGSFANNYLDDEGGACTGSDASRNVHDSAKQARLCKYSNVTPSGAGPNYMCDSTPITPLTSTRATLDSAIGALVAKGNTNVLEGLMWGWRTLSPGAPFTEGAAYNTKHLYKVMIVMSDGEQNIPYASNMNKSVYSSYGYMSKGRLMDSTPSKTSQIRTAIDNRLKLACANAKAQGITIYTVALGEADSALLKSCASDPKYAYAPKDGAELTPVFLAIAADINKLRIAE